MSTTVRTALRNRMVLLELAVLLGGILLVACPLEAQTFSVLHAFAGDGRAPLGTLIRDTNGNLYGTTQNGGAGANGTVFKLSPQGQLTVLHSFAGDPDGASPSAGVVMDPAGNLYGVTPDGGVDRSGTVFKIDANGHETVLYSFQAGSDGLDPKGSLALDAAGNLYGTTSAATMISGGTVFKVNTNAAFSTLYSFKADTDGKDPRAGVLVDGVGNLYGTTRRGGHYADGIVFKLDPQEKLTIIHSFSSFPDGMSPQAPVIVDSAGNFYGTTEAGGAYSSGTVFKIDTSNHSTILHSFNEGPNDGQGPQAGLVRDSAGNLYGTTPFGGSSSQGTVFKIDSTGEETIVHSFTGGDDGGYPYAGLVMDSEGNLYGAAANGGSGLSGTIFKIAAQ